MNSRVVGPVRLPGHTPTGVGSGRVLFGQAAVGEHPPSLRTGAGRGRRVPGVGPSGGPVGCSRTLGSVPNAVGVCSACHLEHPYHRRPFLSYWRRNGWLDHDPMKLVDRRRQPRDQTRSIPYQDLEALWSRRKVSLREKTLWRMLYETAARAGEILALNVEDLDLTRKRAVIIGKGGHREYVFWASGPARLLSPPSGRATPRRRTPCPLVNSVPVQWTAQVWGTYLQGRRAGLFTAGMPLGAGTISPTPPVCSLAFG